MLFGVNGLSLLLLLLLLLCRNEFAILHILFYCLHNYINLVQELRAGEGGKGGWGVQRDIADSLLAGVFP